jgi:hypothetical protein
MAVKYELLSPAGTRRQLSAPKEGWWEKDFEAIRQRRATGPIWMSLMKLQFFRTTGSATCGPLLGYGEPRSAAAFVLGRLLSRVMRNTRHDE